MLRFRVRLELARPTAAEAIQVLRSLLGPVRAEPGCTATRLLRDLDDGAAVTFEEEWQDYDRLESHLKTAAFRKVLAVMDLAARHPEVEIDEIASRRGFDLIVEALGHSVEAHTIADAEENVS
jgi:quinol monooxygenase YgiN